MDNTAKILFEYLRKVFYNSSQATLDIDKLDKDFVNFAKGLMYFAQCFSQYNELAQALAKGDLSVPLPPPENELAAPLKSLHASLKHLTWQSQQVAMGDYKQRVDFMGEFSDAFNTMIAQLAERQQKLENEIELGRKKTAALEQSNQLLTNITQNISQQIIVINRDTLDILYMNNSAQNEIDNNEAYIKNLLAAIPASHNQNACHNIEIQYGQDEETRYLSIHSYLLEWHNCTAEAFVIKDISAEKSQIKELESYAYHDFMTNLHNRLSGMLTLDHWLEEKRKFVLVFADLDKLKYMNDRYGHKEGDKYIINAAKRLKVFSPDAVVSRIGGDEFMLLVPNITPHEARIRMEDVLRQLQNDGYLINKEYRYSLSFGIVLVSEENQLPATDILSLADEMMYEQKRMKKQHWLKKQQEKEN